MGFLKGRWSSLRGLRVRIDNEKGMHFASLWITACIHLHAFAMDHEDARFITRDKFFKLGKRIMRRERQRQREWDEAREQVAEQIEADMEERGEVELLEGKLKRERLKKELFAHLNVQ
jgi:serine phosphatase RsbU (regulator of sigma subunit)